MTVRRWPIREQLRGGDKPAAVAVITAGRHVRMFSRPVPATSAGAALSGLPPRCGFRPIGRYPMRRACWSAPSGRNWIAATITRTPSSLIEKPWATDPIWPRRRRARRRLARRAPPTLLLVTGPDRLEHDGRVLRTRDALARVSGQSPATLEQWWAARERNGHPPGEQIGGQLYFDDSEWHLWRAERGAERRTIAGRILVTRRELTRISGIGDRTLARWYAHRGENGHPEGLRLDTRLYLDEQNWWRWHDAHHAARRAHLTEVRPGGDPDELLNATQAARLLGYRNPATVRAYVKRHQFIEPDAVAQLPSGGARQLWTRRRLWKFAAQRSRSWAGADPSRSRSGRCSSEVLAQ